MKKKDQPATPVHVSVYDGCTFVGTIDENRAGKFRAKNSSGKLVGEYQTQIAAMRALPTAASTR